MSFLKMTGLNIFVNWSILLTAVLLSIRYVIKHWILFLVKIATHSG